MMMEQRSIHCAEVPALFFCHRCRSERCRSEMEMEMEIEIEMEMEMEMEMETALPLLTSPVVRELASLILSDLRVNTASPLRP